MIERPILVVGASGFIGNGLWRKLPEAMRYGTFCNHPSPDLIYLDIRDPYETFNSVRRLSPSVIFQPAGLPNVDWCEEHRDDCWATNVQGTANLVNAAKEIGAKFVYFSSDYVFDGKNGPYTENDEPHPINVYGEAKLEAERLVQEKLEDYLIIRVTVVYGWEKLGKNFAMVVIKHLSLGNPMKVPVDQIGTPTYAENMIDVVLELTSLNQTGIFNVVGSKLMDRYTFACYIVNVFNLDRELLVPVTTTELKQKASRPLKAGLLIDKVRSIAKTNLMGPVEGLSLMRREGTPF